MLVSLLYNCVLMCLGFFYLAIIAYKMVVHEKYRQSFLSRLGFGFPDIKKGEKQLIWIHAVSMGETKAIAPLVKQIKNEAKNAIIVLSTATETGHQEGIRSAPEADYHVYLPYDLWWIIRPIVNRVKPDVVILCEGDYWYNFLNCSKKVGASIIVVNGKLSEKSLQSFLKIPFFAKKLFGFVDRFCLQSTHYKERFLQLGVSESKIEVTGNIKMDGHYPRLTETELSDWKKKFRLEEGDLLLVAGSTHDPEEQMLVDFMHKAWKTMPRLGLLLVPRHPERFNDVAKLLEKNNISYTKYSTLAASQQPARVILMDQMGLLRQCYQLADLAFVGGTYTSKVGGHNIMEPAWYGVPVVFGPHLHSQPEMLTLMLQYNAGLRVPPEKFADTLIELLENAAKRKSIGNCGSNMAKELTGAAKRTFHEIYPFLSL